MNEVEEEVERIKAFIGNSDDLIVRRESRTSAGGGFFYVLYIDGMTDTERLEEGIFSKAAFRELRSIDAQGIQNAVSEPMSFEDVFSMDEAVERICSGDAVLVTGGGKYVVVGSRSFPVRSPTEPPTSAVLKGPREGFIEDIKTNTILMRRRFKSGKLVVKSFKVGKYSSTDVELLYIEGVADEALVHKLSRKITEIRLDGVVDSSYIAKFLEKRNYSIFRQNGTTEKPDILAAKLLEGRIGILVDGSPIALTIPFTIMEDLQDSQDYFKRNARASMVRLIRITAVFFSALLPGVFVALQMHQFQMFPLRLLINVINSINGTPFSPVVEMLIALIFFEVLGEASVRMPRYVGMAISIVGAIILGETAVKAGVLSSLTVLITAMSGIGLYAIPDEVGTFSVIRVLLVLIGGSTGMFGIILGVCGLVAYVASMDVYGADYLAPIAPVIWGDLKDSIVKFELPDMKKRPVVMGSDNRTRLGLPVKDAMEESPTPKEGGRGSDSTYGKEVKKQEKQGGWGSEKRD